jgi:transposase-like protein
LSIDSERRRDAEGRFAPNHSEAERAAVHADYVAGILSIDAISEKHSIAKSTIYEWASDECWARRRPRRVDPNNLLSRMLALLDRHTEDMEDAMKKGATEVVMLAKLVTTLDKVLLLKERMAPEPPRPSKRVEELRAQIAERLVELNRA